MLSKKLQIVSVIPLIMLLGSVHVNGAFNGSGHQRYTNPQRPQDACSRPLYHTNGTPLYYRDHCPAPNNIIPLEDNPPSDRFEAAHVAYSTGGSWVEAVSMDDFDRDGKLDMVVSTSYYLDPLRDQRVWVARQDTPLSFSLVHSATIGALSPTSLDVADMNGDGYLDIVVANEQVEVGDEGDVRIFWGTGDFSFIRTDHTAGNNPYAVAVIPVYNNYTRTLAVVTNVLSDFLSSYLGETGYSVTRTDYLAPQAGFNQLATGDLNNDGNQDIAAMWGQLDDAAFTEYFGDGQGSLSVGPSFPKHDRNPTAIAVGDVTNDGRDDVIIARGSNRPYVYVLVYAQDPTGHLALTATYPSFDMPESLDVADVNCDGINDLIATNSGWFAFSWWPGKPDGTLGLYQIEWHSFYFSHVGPNGAEMADVNGDGLKDYVVVDYNVNGVLVALQRPCFKNKLYLPLIISK